MSEYPFEPLVDLSDPAVMRERAAARNVAAARYYFWLPCPLCGLEFGGHESMRGTEDRPGSAGRGADPRWNARDAFEESLRNAGVLKDADTAP
jgi:hypothetical protein